MMTKLKVKTGLLWGVLVGLLILSGCESANQAPVAMPDVNISCSEGSCGVALNGARVFVYLTRSGCGDTATFEPVAAGNTTVSCLGSTCTGTVSTWSDSNSNAVTEILSGRHDVCAYIDSSPVNSQQDTGEMEHQGSYTISDGTPITLDSWDATP